MSDKLIVVREGCERHAALPRRPKRSSKDVSPRRVDDPPDAGRHSRHHQDCGALGGGARPCTEREELARLRKENRQLRPERDVLGKAAAFFAKENETSGYPQGGGMAAWADSATVADLIARVGALTDSTRSLADQIATLRAERAIDHVPNWHGLTPWMGAGWFVTAAGIITAGILAVRGWKKNADTAQQGWVEAARTAREAQDHRQALEDNSARDVFLDMLAESLQYFLWQLPFLIKQVEKDGFIGARQLDHLDAARAGYDRNREGLVLITDTELRRRIGRWFYGARIWRSSVERYYVVGTPEHGANIGVVKWALSGSLKGVLAEGRAIYEALDFPRKYPNEEAYDSLVRAEQEAAAEEPKVGEKPGD